MLTASDFAERLDQPELMDEVSDYGAYSTLIRGLSRIDRYVLAHRPTFRFLSRVVASLPNDFRPLHIVDVGCGDGDLLRRIARWARRRRRRVLLTGVDLNPLAIQAAIDASRLAS